MSQKQQIQPIQDLWLKYKSILPRDASVTQLREVRRAFFAGARELFILMVNSAGMMKPVSIQMFSDIRKDIDDFHRGIGSGDDQN